jgi:hydroxymethylglutaryl-CoA reductase
MSKSISGFSKLSKIDKIDWIISTYFSGNHAIKDTLKQYWNSNDKLQQLHDEFIENTISNYYLPFAVAPNFLINGEIYTLPMAIEESSVVAAASRAAKFWMERGGFKAEVISTIKIGHVHFMFSGNSEKLQGFFDEIKTKILSDVQPITKNMERRGGGVLDIQLKNKTELLDNYYQLEASFETKDAMGANFINSCLEQFSSTLKTEANEYSEFTPEENQIEIVMCILSNYVPECLVKAEVSCNVENLNEDENISANDFAEKFIRAIQIAEVEPYRAVTHNKGIMNGIDAVVLATGNDFRAVEAGVHAYASRHGSYTSLTHASVENGVFKFWLEIPLALGTVGGLTKLHPLVKFALELLGKPSAEELMKIVAVAGLAQNFGAIRSLITTGIQQGHMKMHLMNMLNQYEATANEKLKLIEHFKSETVSHTAVIEALNDLRVKS